MLIAPPRVLLVEDAPAIREALQTALGGAGYVVSSQTES
jgi:CheY-like chemotaxis protein